MGDDAAVGQVRPPAHSPQHHQKGVDGSHGDRHDLVHATEHERPQRHAGEEQQVEQSVREPSERAHGGDRTEHGAHLGGIFAVGV